ncbi:hypothetical protein BDK51DRAFT_11788, partial [Blyttiomyces helicus]
KTANEPAAAEDAEDTEWGVVTRVKIPPKPVPKKVGPKGTIYDFSLEFLAELAEDENNRREWFQLNENRYQAAKSNFVDLVDVVLIGLRRLDPTILEAPGKSLLFRINRDVRFSADKSPYKKNLSAGFTSTGRKGETAGYYLEISGSGAFVGGGLWMPPADKLASIRTHLAADASPLDRAFTTKALRREFGTDGEKALIAQAGNSSLKTAPKGYAKDHPRIRLLRLKSFALVKRFKKTEVLAEGFSDKVIQTLEGIVPLVNVLNQWI